MWTKPTPTAVARQLRAASQALMIGTEALLPAYCLVCDERCGVPRWLCPRCEQKITPNTSECPNAYSLNLAPVSQVAPPAQNHYAITARREPLNSAYAAFLHRGVMRELIHQWKFEQRPELTPFLVQLAFALGHPIPIRRLRHTHTHALAPTSSPRIQPECASRVGIGPWIEPAPRRADQTNQCPSSSANATSSTYSQSHRATCSLTPSICGSPPLGQLSRLTC